MTTINKVISVDNYKKLIDLNEDSINFDITFTVSSENGEPFNVVIVDQTMLDSGKELEYKTITDGSISGKLVNDKNVYQNYFLCLRSDSPCKCNVQIIRKDIQPSNVLPEQKIVEKYQETLIKSKETGFFFKWRWYIFFLIVACVIGYWYINKNYPNWFLFNKNVTNSVINLSFDSIENNNLSDNIVKSRISSVSKSSSRGPSSSASSSASSSSSSSVSKNSSPVKTNTFHNLGDRFKNFGI